MKEEKIKLLFYLKRGASNSAGKCPIMGHITIGRTMVQFSSKCSCNPSLWDSRKNRLVGKSAEAVSINRELDRLHASVHSIYSDLRQREESVSAEAVRERLLGLNMHTQGLLYHLDEYLARFRERVGINRSERRYKSLLLFRKHLADFIKHRYRVEELPAQRADLAFIKELENFFSLERGFKLNTTAGYLSMLASLLKDLHKRHIIDTYPFIGYSIRWDVGSPRFITRAEVERIASLDETQLQSYELVSRDMFLFSCFTGLSYTDVYHLTEAHLFEEGGITWIRKPREKTAKLCHIPLLPEAKAIIERYRGIHARAFRHEPPQGYLLPIPGCDTVNIHLKKIARLCGITKNLTFHVSRHTFATTICLENGLPIETVSKMLGHRFISTTELYAKVTKSKIAKEMQALMGSERTQILRQALQVCPKRKPSTAKSQAPE